MRTHSQDVVLPDPSLSPELVHVCRRPLPGAADAGCGILVLHPNTTHLQAISDLLDATHTPHTTLCASPADPQRVLALLSQQGDSSGVPYDASQLLWAQSLVDSFWAFCSQPEGTRGEDELQQVQTASPVQLWRMLYGS